MKKHLKNLHKAIFTTGRGIALLFAVLLVISAFLPWGSTDNVSVTGLSGDGWITIGVGVIAFILLFIRKAPLWLSLILGLVGLTIGTVDFLAMNDAVKSIQGSIGSGLYLTFISCIGIVLGIIIEMLEERKRKMNLYYFDEGKDED